MYPEKLITGDAPGDGSPDSLVQLIFYEQFFSVVRAADLTADATCLFRVFLYLFICICDRRRPFVLVGFFLSKTMHLFLSSSLYFYSSISLSLSLPLSCFLSLSIFLGFFVEFTITPELFLPSRMHVCVLKNHHNRIARLCHSLKKRVIYFLRLWVRKNTHENP